MGQQINLFFIVSADGCSRSSSGVMEEPLFAYAEGGAARELCAGVWGAQRLTAPLGRAGSSHCLGCLLIKAGIAKSGAEFSWDL